MEINNILNEYFKDKAEKQDVIMYATALWLGKMNTLPTSVVGSPNDYYISNFSLSDREFVSKVNEDIIFDFKRALDLSKSIWLHRYFTLHPRVEGVGIIDNHFFSDEERLTVTKYREGINALFLHFNKGC